MEIPPQPVPWRGSWGLSSWVLGSGEAGLPTQGGVMPPFSGCFLQSPERGRKGGPEEASQHAEICSQLLGLCGEPGTGCAQPAEERVCRGRAFQPSEAWAPRLPPRRGHVPVRPARTTWVRPAGTWLPWTGLDGRVFQVSGDNA